MNVKLNEEVARAIGWNKRENEVWLNSWGAPVSSLPDFSGDINFSGVVVRHFESLDQKINGNNQGFFARYKPEMSAKEVCELTLEILGESRDF